MSYRIVEVAQSATGGNDKTVEIGSFDSAYHAVAAMRRAFFGRANAAPPNWYLVNSIGQVLAGPDDILDMDS